MKMRSALLLSIAILVLRHPAAAQTTDDLFNGDVLQEVRLTINPKDWAQLRLDYLGDNYYAVDFHWIYNGKDIYSPQVAVRSRGTGSRSPIKPSLKIEFDRFVSRDNFLGLRNLVLRANTQDASMMHERVAMELFRRMGIPAPRESHTRLYINGAYAGLYTIVEEVDQPFLMRNLGQEGGFLYNYEWADAWFFDYRGTNPSNYSPIPFKLETNFDRPDPFPLVAMVLTINQAADAQFEMDVSQYLDLDNFVREIAAENFVADQDGIIGDFGLNNFFLYRLQNQLSSIFIPWDKSNAFFSRDWPILHNVDTNVLSRRVFAQAHLLADYLDYLRLAADIAGGPGGWMEQEITKEYLQIRQAAYDDALKLCGFPLRPCSNGEFEAEVSYMIQFARQRSSEVRSQIDGGAAASSP
jgi:spore coat protein CotH